MKKIVINECYGGYGLSQEVLDRLSIIYGKEVDEFDITRDDVNLVSIIEEIGVDAASGEFAQLKIVEIPDDVQWEISNYDGIEKVCERHRKWW